MSEDTNHISGIKELRRARNKLDDQRRALMSQADELHKQIREIDMQIARLTYTCCCVELNDDLGIYNMTEQVERGRVGLQFGLVAETLSAKKDCQFCHGEGKLTEENEDQES